MYIDLLVHSVLAREVDVEGSRLQGVLALGRLLSEGVVQHLQVDDGVEQGRDLLDLGREGHVHRDGFGQAEGGGQVQLEEVKHFEGALKVEGIALFLFGYHRSL